MPRPRRRSWTEAQLRQAIASSRSVRQAIGKLGLREAGGNYEQIKKYIAEYNIDTSHLKAQAWNRGMRGIGKPRIELDAILRRDTRFPSHKLKLRLFAAGLKRPCCEACGWARRSADGRIPVELDHINGDRYDNRLENLRILCPNCHSLKPTHRGRNKRKQRPGGGTGRHTSLKMM